MKCPKCEFENREGAKFCGNCRAKLSRICPECKSENPPQNKFCDECGHDLTIPGEPPPKELSFEEKLAKIQRYLPKGLTEKILSQRDRIEGERKQVTVMFCDMEGFTALSEKLGPEEAYSVMDQVYEILIHKVHEYEGTVNEMTGDGIVALFGAPIALEDAPQRAIRSAYAIHREMNRFSDQINQQRGLQPIRMRIGVHTGPVVVGTLGNDLRVEFKAVGDTVNLASRVESLAEPGSTYVTEDTFKLTEGFFRFEALGEREVKGKDELIKVYRVIAPSSRRTRFDVSAERGLTPFVGRERELELLVEGFERSKSGRGQAFSIVAEAGLGKSRLLYEFRKAVANEDVTFLEGNCLSYSRNFAYHPLTEILRSNFNIQEGEEDPDIREKVIKGLKTLGADSTATLPYLLELLSVKDSGIDEILVAPEARKDRIIEALRHVVIKGSELRPLIIAVENLHWIDRSSEDSLRFVLESISGARVFLIFTYRSEYVQAWAARSYHSQVTLNRLSNRESLSMVTHVLGTKDLDRALEELILEKTEGVPFFIEEFVKSLRDLKIIEKKNNIYCMSEDIRTVAIPAQIQDVIMARLDSLPEDAKKLIQAGSVAGREFGHDLIKNLAGLSESELLSQLSVLKDSELVYERGIYPKVSYIFKHALIQDVAYRSMLKSSRQKYHRKTAEVLEEHFHEIAKTQPEILAYHLTEAGFGLQAIQYWQEAGETAIKRSAHVEAVAHFTKNLELLDSIPEAPKRMGRELTVRLSMGPALMVTKGFASPEVKDNYSRARVLCQQVGDEQQLFQALHGLYIFHVNAGAFQTSFELGNELLKMAQREKDGAFLVLAHRALGMALFWLGDFVSARTHLAQAVALYKPQQHHPLTFAAGSHVILHCLLFNSLTLQWLGYPDQALNQMQEAVGFAEELLHPFSMAGALVISAFLHCARRQMPAAQEQAEAVIALSAQKRFPYFEAAGNVFLGWAFADQGHMEKGIMRIREGLKAYGATGAGQGGAMSLAALAEACGKGGQTEEALGLIEQALEWVDKTEDRCWEAELYRLKGEFLGKKAEGNGQELKLKAEACFLKALEISRRQSAKSWELRAIMSLSRLWQRQGKQEEARQMLTEVYDWFTEGFDTPDLIEAKALLEELF